MFVCLLTYFGKKFCHTFLRNCKAYEVEIWYTRRQRVNVWCIPKSDCWCLFVPLFLHFSFSPIFNITCFCHTSFRNCEAYKLESRYTHGQRVNVACVLESDCCCFAAYSSLYLFIFLSNFQTIVFITLFSGIIRPTKLKLGTHLDNGWMYRVYWNHTAAAYSSLYFFIFLSLQF